MLQTSSNFGGIMESRDHFKNGVSPKDQMSRGNQFCVKQMKKIFLILVTIIGFGFVANAQITKEEYNKLTDSQKEIYDSQQKAIDAKRQEAKEWREAEKIANKADFENRDAFDKPDRNDHLGNKARELEAEAKKEQELLDNSARKAIENNEKKAQETKQNGSIPTWLTGSWYNDKNGNHLFTVTGNLIRWYGTEEGCIGDFLRTEGENVYFRWRNCSRGECRLSRVSLDQVVYANPTSGNSYVATKK